MELVRRHQARWDTYLEHPETNPLMFGHPEQVGEVVLQNALCYFLQGDGEVLPGSGMIMPKAARATVFDLTPDEWAATYALLQEVRTYLDERLKPDGYSVGWNVMPVGGQHVPQAHLHIIPRFADEPYAGRGIRFWLKGRENLRPKG